MTNGPMASQRVDGQAEIITLFSLHQHNLANWQLCHLAFYNLAFYYCVFFTIGQFTIVYFYHRVFYHSAFYVSNVLISYQLLEIALVRNDRLFLEGKILFHLKPSKPFHLGAL